MESPSINVAESSNSNSKPRVRSVAYTAYTIESCIKFTEKIDKEFTSVMYTPKEVIAKHLRTSGGAFLMQLSSSGQYELLDIKPKEGYKPSARFKKIQKPVPGENVNDFLLECFQSPPLYKKLISQFNDKELPSESGLANILDRNYKVKGKAAELAAKVFLKNVISLGLISAGNIFKMDTYIPYAEETEETENNQPSDDAEKKVESRINMPLLVSTEQLAKLTKSNKTKEIPIYIKSEDNIDREAKVIMPFDFTDDDIKRVIKVLSGYLN